VDNLQKPNKRTESALQKPFKFGILIVIFLCCTSLLFIILFSYYYVTLNNEIQSINNMATLQPINNITRLYNQTNLINTGCIVK
jgi:heme/copper-type cytochrome/quinol oxidase subunit 3